ncbi:MAG: hypothetical protein ACW99Q_15000 [Candidatus Kariarchaeaceae archaeon]|jgi:hypothetical protein
MRFDKVEVIGSFWMHRVADADTHPHKAVDEGRLIYSIDNERVYYGSNTEWVLLTTAYDVIDQGQRMLFGSWPLPTGWNITNRDDVSVAIISAGGGVGSLGSEVGESSTWAITGIQEQGSHSHGGQTGNPDRVVRRGTSDAQEYVAQDNHKHSLIVDGLHSHSFTGTWRPHHIKLAEGEYQ